jgi:chemotaxis protein methyltransferase CheR
VPCATGEEPLTIAMLLSEAGWFDRADFELVGSDASLEAIRRAQRGLYPERSFRNLPAALREKYFSREREGWRAAPSLHERISYDVVNLMDSRQTSRYVTAPVVFCRNVFIYFSDQSIRRVVESFERSMPAPGYLCVGAAESLLRRTNVFDLQEIGGAFMYVKGKDVDSGAPDLPVLASRERAS